MPLSLNRSSRNAARRASAGTVSAGSWGWLRVGARLADDGHDGQAVPMRFDSRFRTSEAVRPARPLPYPLFVRMRRRSLNACSMGSTVTPSMSSNSMRLRHGKANGRKIQSRPANMQAIFILQMKIRRTERQQSPTRHFPNLEDLLVGMNTNHELIDVIHGCSRRTYEFGLPTSVTGGGGRLIGRWCSTAGIRSAAPVRPPPPFPDGHGGRAKPGRGGRR